MLGESRKKKEKKTIIITNFARYKISSPTNSESISNILRYFGSFDTISFALTNCMFRITFFVCVELGALEEELFGPEINYVSKKHKKFGKKKKVKNKMKKSFRSGRRNRNKKVEEIIEEEEDHEEEEEENTNDKNSLKRKNKDTKKKNKKNESGSV